MSEQKPKTYRSIYDCLNHSESHIDWVLEGLLTIEFTETRNVYLQYKSFFTICKDLDLSFDKEVRLGNQAAKNAAKPALSSAKVGFTDEVSEVFTDFELVLIEPRKRGVPKYFKVNGNHPMYTKGVFEWNPLYCFVQLEDGFVKLAYLQYDENNNAFSIKPKFVKNGKPTRNAKPKESLPNGGGDRYIPVTAGGVTVYVDSHWCVGKYFHDTTAYNRMMKSRSESEITATPNSGSDLDLDDE